MLRNENGVVIPLIKEIDEPFRGVYGDFKSYVDILLTIRSLPPIKTTESVLYDVEC